MNVNLNFNLKLNMKQAIILKLNMIGSMPVEIKLHTNGLILAFLEIGLY